jgi:Asp-tRNA(Asn)/Glu-tRNA(Gln) amidotransferase C subunit
MDAPMRPDVPDRCSDRSEILAQAPESEAGGFAVPLVLEVE